MRPKPVTKFIFLILIAGLAFGAWKIFSGGQGLSAILGGKESSTSKVPVRADLPTAATEQAAANNADFRLPSSKPVESGKPEIRMLIWAWNSQLGGLFANGGATTTEGSLMAKNGVNLRFIRQDDAAKMQEELVTFANELKKGNDNPTIGANYVAIMGDGAATFLQGINPVLAKLGPEYKARVIGSMGYSRGEDKFMGPQSWKNNPQASKGGVVSGYLRDGDWNIAQKWLGDNNLRNNPDEKTYDPDALNWVAANDYIDAAEKYVSGYSEERPVVRNGKRTGETHRVTVQGVVTWTPGDVTVAQKKGGIVSIVSTREYSSQMPNVIIGIDKWNKDHPEQVQGMLQAIFTGGDAIKSSSAALTQASKIASSVFNEPGAGPEYWEKYYRGVVERDKTGVDVELGGSSVNNLADNMLLFGLVPGSANLFKATYETFGNIVKDQYPELLPTYPPVGEAFDPSFVQRIASRNGPTSTEISRASPPKMDPKAPIKKEISRKVWRIQFATGKAEFTETARAQMEKILNDLLIAGSTSVVIEGHTDNVGNPATNMSLSEARAFAVKGWLERRSPVNFPSGRVKIKALGSTVPRVPNTSDENRAQNRRVEIILGATN